MQFLKVLTTVAIGVLLVAPMAQAKNYTVQMGANNGRLIFVPNTLTLAKGDTVNWTVGKAGPHNVVFSKAPAGVDVKAISHTKLVAKTDPSFVSTFATPGDYAYNCVPHKGAGMVAKITVK